MARPERYTGVQTTPRFSGCCCVGSTVYMMSNGKRTRSPQHDATAGAMFLSTKPMYRNGLETSFRLPAYFAGAACGLSGLVTAARCWTELSLAEALRLEQRCSARERPLAVAAVAVAAMLVVAAPDGSVSASALTVRLESVPRRC